MKNVLVVVALLTTTTAFAAAPKVYVANGSIIAQEKALDAALAGQKVMACAPMELSRNAKGTGVTLKNKKQ